MTDILLSLCVASQVMEAVPPRIKSPVSSPDRFLQAWSAVTAPKMRPLALDPLADPLTRIWQTASVVEPSALPKSPKMVPQPPPRCGLLARRDQRPSAEHAATLAPRRSVYLAEDLMRPWEVGPGEQEHARMDLEDLMHAVEGCSGVP